MTIQTRFATVALLACALLTACGGSSGTQRVPDTERVGAFDRNAPEAVKLSSGSWCSEGPRMKRYTFAENGELFILQHPGARRVGPGPGQFARGSWGYVAPRLFVRQPDRAMSWIADFSRPRVILLHSEPGAPRELTVKLRRCGPNPYRG